MFTARHCQLINIEMGRKRRALLLAARREEERWQEHNSELAKEHHRALFRCREGSWEWYAEKGAGKDAGKHTSEDTGKGKGKVKPNLDLWRSGGSGQGNRGPNLRQAGCRISNPWWVDPPCREPSPQHERAEGEGGEEPSPQHTVEFLRAELQRLERICYDRSYNSTY
jgi:hypothetical protein